MTKIKVLIVGGVAGGASAAARLRRLDENAEIIMFEKGDYISFANCGLPYFIGDVIKEKSSLTLQTPESFYKRFNIDVRINSEIMSINSREKTVTVRKRLTGEEYVESYDKLILSMGAEPIKPPIEGANSNKVFTLRNIPDTYSIKNYINKHQVKKAVVVGGGYIGVEMAENLRHIGLDVTIVEMQNQVIAPLDYDMACDVHRHMESHGVKLVLSHAVQAIKEEGHNLKVILEDGELITDIVILSIGVKPESKLAIEAGLKVSDRGGIVVNDYMKTSDDNVFAIGDVIEIKDFVTSDKSLIPLAGPANKQGRIAADNINEDESSAYTGTQGSAILKVFDMTVATTGINERTAQKLNLNYDKAFTYSASHAGYYPGGTNMSIKTIFENNSGKILGAQIVGYDGVDKRCDVIATAIRFGGTANDLTKLELCYAPPYSSAKDPVNMAGFTIENKLTGKLKEFYWNDVENLPRDGSITLLDVRTEMEFFSGKINGFFNIPLDDLRNRLNELDKKKPVYLYCHIGLRGYIACRILEGNGFECYNLSGGYRLYESIIHSQSVQDAPCYPKL